MRNIWEHSVFGFTENFKDNDFSAFLKFFDCLIIYWIWSFAYKTSDTHAIQGRINDIENWFPKGGRRIGDSICVMGVDAKLEVPENLKVESEEILNHNVSVVLIEGKPNAVEHGDLTLVWVY